MPDPAAARASGAISRQRAAAGAIVLIACGFYLVAESISASAWRDPAYSYARNYISDLGIPCGAPSGIDEVCSRLAGVMNTGFVLAGVFCVAAALLLRPLAARNWRPWLLGLAAVHGAGSILVGFMHSAPGTQAGTPAAHVVGAYMAVLGGNLAIAVAGLAMRRVAKPWFVGMSVGLGGLGYAGAIALVAAGTSRPGLLERAAVDTVTVWEVTTGVVILIALATGRLAGVRR